MTSQYKAMQEKLTKKKEDLEELVEKNEKIIEDKEKTIKEMEEKRLAMLVEKKDQRKRLNAKRLDMSKAFQKMLHVIKNLLNSLSLPRIPSTRCQRESRMPSGTATMIRR